MLIKATISKDFSTSKSTMTRPRRLQLDQLGEVRCHVFFFAHRNWGDFINTEIQSEVGSLVYWGLVFFAVASVDEQTLVF